MMHCAQNLYKTMLKQDLVVEKREKRNINDLKVNLQINRHSLDTDLEHHAHFSEITQNCKSLTTRERMSLVIVGLVVVI